MGQNFMLPLLCFLGEAFEIREGYGTLPFDISGDTESVVVAPGASFRGYDKKPGVGTSIKNAFSSNPNVRTIKVWMCD